MAMLTQAQHSMTKTLLVVLAVALVLAGMVFVHQQYLPPGATSARGLAAFLRSLHTHRFGAIAVCGAYAFLACAFVPVTALTAAMALVFDAPHAFLYAMTGALLSAALSRAIGQLASGPVLRRMQGPRLHALREGLHANTFSATVAARIVPFGHFTTINLLAGALAVPWLPYMLGNLVGMAFGVAAFTLLTDRVAEVFTAPTPTNVAIAVGGLLAAVGIGLLLTRFVRRRQQRAS